MMRVLLALVASILVAGCTSPYSVKIDGDVQGTDRDTPRVVKAEIHEGSQARAMREAAGRHLRPLTDATVTVGLVFKGTKKQKTSTVKVDSATAQFHFEASGESDEGALEGVFVLAKANGREAVSRLFPNPPEVPFEAVVMAVLDEAGPSSPSAEAPKDTPKPAAESK
jgi:hypothetical protein